MRRPISYREAHARALRLAYEAIEKAVNAGGEEYDDDASQLRLEDALDTIAQRMFERAMEAEQRFGPWSRASRRPRS